MITSSSSQAIEVGQTIPHCQATMAGGTSTLDFSNYKGKVILVDFWATWCPPCKKSMPFLNGLQNKLPKDSFEIIAINVDEDTEAAKQLLNDNPIDYQIAFDPQGNCPGVFDVKAMPSSYLVDKTGKVTLIHLGFRDGDEAIIREHISALLSE